MKGALFTRRVILIGSSALVCSCAAPRLRSDARSEPSLDALRAIEARLGGRLGVHALDTATGARLGLNEDARFAMASTFKLLLAAAVLERIDRGLLTPAQRVAFGPSDMVPHAPATSAQLAHGSMSVLELCEAVVVVSDNPAANLLLALLGGPSELTRYARSLDDATTRLDRIEPELNTNLPDDPRDTTTPRAMVNTMQRVLTGAALSTSSSQKLIGWLMRSQTGLKRIRAGLPSTWTAGDKTGTGENGAVNDVAIAWPPERAPLLLAIYTSGSQRSVDELSAAHAQLAAVIANAWG
jgi:beta-lactamase class A